MIELMLHSCDTKLLNQETKQKKRSTFKCVYHQDPSKIKSKGTGERDIQHYNAKNCPFTIRVNLNERTNKFEIKQFNNAHNHDLLKDDFLLHPNQRQLTTEMQTAIKQALETKGKPELIRQQIEDRFNVKIAPKQIYNVQRGQKSGWQDVQKIEDFISEMIAKDGENNFDFTYDDSDPSNKKLLIFLYILFI